MKQKGLARGGLALAGAAVIGGLAYLISTTKMERFYKPIHPLQWVDVTGDEVDDAIVVLPNTPDRLPSVGENINQRIYAIDGSKTFQDPHGNWCAKTDDYIILRAKGNLDLLQGLDITPKRDLGALPINARAYRASNGEFESFKFTSQGEGRDRVVDLEISVDQGIAGILGRYKLHNIRPVAVNDFYSHSESWKGDNK